MFVRAFAVTAIILPAFATSVAAADCARTYTIVQGDICDSISAANNVSTYQLAVINPSIDAACSNLIPGDTLCLGTVGEDCQTTYVVSPDDTCEGIASAHAINTTLLSLNNPQVDSECSNIYIGEVLCVGTAVQVPPVPTTGIPATTIPATAVNPTSTSAAASFTSSAATATPSASSDDDEDDDNIPEDQLPFCDELDDDE